MYKSIEDIDNKELSNGMRDTSGTPLTEIEINFVKRETERIEADFKIDINYHTTPIWQDECRASIIAAKTTPNLSENEKRDLILDAIYRAQEYGQLIETDSFMKEILYGYSEEKSIITEFNTIRFISESSQTGNFSERNHDNTMSSMPNRTQINYDCER